MCKKHPLFEESCCAYDLNCQEVKTLPNKNLVQYMCRRCGKFSILPHLKWAPCKKRTTEVSPHKYLCWTVGKAAANNKLRRSRQASLKLYHAKPKVSRPRDPQQWQRQGKTLQRLTFDKYEKWLATMERGQTTAGNACTLDYATTKDGNDHKKPLRYQCKRCKVYRIPCKTRWEPCSKPASARPLTKTQFQRASKKATRGS